MARRKSPTLTDAELRLMKILWEFGPATVNEVIGRMPEKNRPAYSSVLTILRILEQKGYLAHETQGRAFIYSPVVDRGEARKSILRYVLDRFFNNSPELLVQNILETEDMEKKDLVRLKKMIEEIE